MKKRFFSLIALTLAFIFILTGCNANIDIVESDTFKEKAEAASFEIETHTEYSDVETLVAAYYATTEGGHVEYFLFEDVSTAEVIFKNYYDTVDKIYNEGGANSALTIGFENYKRLQITKLNTTRHYDAIRIDNMIIFAYAETSTGINNVKNLIKDLGL